MTATTTKKILVSAGDSSGDLLLSKIIESLKTLAAENNQELEFRGLCGSYSEARGVEKIVSSKEVSVTGIVEVLKNLPKLFEVLGHLGKISQNSDLVITVDFPDFNFRLAEIAKKFSKPVVHIIAPQVWAWRSSRLNFLSKKIDSLYPALAFEEELFKSAGLYTRYFGHPLRDLLPPKNRRQSREFFSLQNQEKLWVWMPGSRKNEIKTHYPLFVEAFDRVLKMAPRYYGRVEKMKNLKVGVALAPGWTEKDLDKFLSERLMKRKEDWKNQNLLFFSPENHSLLQGGDWGWIASGTATLEAAYYQLPHILIYKLSRFSAFLIKFFSNYFQKKEAFVGLPNILMNQSLIPELLQEHLTPERLALETLELLENESRLAQIKRDLKYLPSKMGDPGMSLKIAQDIFKRHLKK